MPSPTDPLTTALPRVLRHLAPPVTPWPAGLVGDGGTGGLLVDATLLPATAFGPPEVHLARPLEVYRTGAGHVVLMPLLDRPLPPAEVADLGAAVTLAVSVLRGVVAAEAHPTGPGAWWLTPEGRPVFVPVAEGGSIRATAAALLRACAAGTAQAELDQLAEELDDPDPLPLDGWEERLFALGTPGVLRLDRPGPEPSRRERRQRVQRVRSRRGATWAERLSDAGVQLWRRVRGRAPGGRRLVLVVAGAAALLVVVVGLNWPEAGADAPEPVASAIDAPALQSQQASDAPPAMTGADDPAAVAAALLERLRGCGQDAACRATVLEDPARELPHGPALDDPAATTTLVDDLGGIAVVRVDGGGAGQIVLIVARDDTWLVRDVYDAADQP